MHCSSGYWLFYNEKTGILDSYLAYSMLFGFDLFSLTWEIKQLFSLTN